MNAKFLSSSWSCIQNIGVTKDNTFTPTTFVSSRLSSRLLTMGMKILRKKIIRFLKVFFYAFKVITRKIRILSVCQTWVKLCRSTTGESQMGINVGSPDSDGQAKFIKIYYLIYLYRTRSLKKNSSRLLAPSHTSTGDETEKTASYSRDSKVTYFFILPIFKRYLANFWHLRQLILIRKNTVKWSRLISLMIFKTTSSFVLEILREKKEPVTVRKKLTRFLCKNFKSDDKFLSWWWKSFDLYQSKKWTDAFWHRVLGP